MDAMQVKTELDEVFRDVFDDPTMQIQRDTTADDVDGWDSARMVEIIIASESRFGVTFTTRETDSLKCVGDLIDLVTRKTSAPAS